MKHLSPKIYLTAIYVALISGYADAKAHPMAEASPRAQTAAVVMPVSIATSPNSLATPSAQPLNLPSMTGGASFYEQYRNRALAAWSLRQIYAGTPLIRDAWSVQVLSQMAGQMNGSVRIQPLYATVLIDDAAINAFAVPGGLIGMNAGTVMQSSALDEVASVMAHEIAHISQRHYEARLDNKNQLLALQLGSVLAAIAASAAGGGDAALVAMAGSQAMSAENAASHSREHEREADRVGMQILAQAGFDARAMPRFFAKLQQQLNLNQSKNAFMPSFMQSHPFTAERMSEATTRAASYPAIAQSSRERQAVLFDQWLWRLKYLTKRTSYTELSAQANQSLGARLALSMYLADNSRHDEAARTLSAAKIDKFDPLYCITSGHLSAAKRDYQAAVAAISACQALYPERRDLRIIQADYAVDAGEPVQALSLIRPLTTPVHQEISQDIEAWDIAFRAYQALADSSQDEKAKTIATINALQARSMAQMWRTQYTGALRANAQAAELADKDAQSRSMLSVLNADKQAIIAARDFKP